MTYSDEFIYALRMLSELRNSGYRTVPASPSPEMLAAGVACSELPSATVEKIYRAMLQAADCE